MTGPWEGTRRAGCIGPWRWWTLPDQIVWVVYRRGCHPMTAGPRRSWREWCSGVWRRGPMRHERWKWSPGRRRSGGACSKQSTELAEELCLLELPISVGLYRLYVSSVVHPTRICKTWQHLKLVWQLPIHAILFDYQRLLIKHRKSLGVALFLLWIKKSVRM